MTRSVNVLVLLLAVGLASPAAAQVQTGSILVKAMDQQGAVMPGVTVTISSPVLVSGTMTGVTDAGGVYRFPSLLPGIYAVKLELSGLPVHRPRERRGARRPDDAGRSLDEGRRPWPKR